MFINNSYLLTRDYRCAKVHQKQCKEALQPAFPALSFLLNLVDWTPSSYVELCCVCYLFRYPEILVPYVNVMPKAVMLYLSLPGENTSKIPVNNYFALLFYFLFYFAPPPQWSQRKQVEAL